MKSRLILSLEAVCTQLHFKSRKNRALLQEIETSNIADERVQRVLVEGWQDNVGVVVRISWTTLIHVIGRIDCSCMVTDAWRRIDGPVELSMC